MATMHRLRRRGTASLHKLYAVVAAGLLASAAAVAVTAASASAQTACSRELPEPPQAIQEVPWAQAWLSPERVWPLSRGNGVVVAVIDTGVDARHPQLRGRVRPGRDTIGSTDGRVDCDGSSHGTAVASLIGASVAEGVGFAGLAPGAEILPVRVAERADQRTGEDGEPPVSPARLAEAIRWATDQGAQVINLSVAFYRDHRVIAEAITDALDRGVVVVAAVGNRRSEEGLELTPYPAAYPGVIGVGALDANGLGSISYVGPEVDLVAPGESVTAAAAGEGHRILSGSSFATPLVSAAGALLLASEPGLTGPEVARRLFTTASPGPGTRAESGHGVVNPYRALTERLVDEPPQAAEPPPPVAVDPVAEARAARWQGFTERAMWTATVTLAVGVLAVAGRAVWRRGRRRGWRPTRQDPGPTAPGPGVDEPHRRFYIVPTARDYWTD